MGLHHGDNSNNSLVTTVIIHCYYFVLTQNVLNIQNHTSECIEQTNVLKHMVPINNAILDTILV